MRNVRCRDCGRSFRVAEAGAAHCPHCGRPQPPEQGAARANDPAEGDRPADLAPVGRATNLAEAGYFQSVLEDQGIPTYIDTQHEASQTGFGARSVVLLVSEGHVPRALELLAEASRQDADAPLAHEDAETVSPTGADDSWAWWKPLLVAGAFVGAAILLLRALSSVPPPAPRPAATQPAERSRSRSTPERLPTGHRTKSWRAVPHRLSTRSGLPPGAPGGQRA